MKIDWGGGYNSQIIQLAPEQHFFLNEYKFYHIFELDSRRICAARTAPHDVSDGRNKYEISD